MSSVAKIADLETPIQMASGKRKLSDGTTVRVFAIRGTGGLTPTARHLAEQDVTTTAKRQ